MRRRDWFLIVSAAIIDAPRVVDAYAGLHGGKVTWEAWPLMHGLSGLGMACIGAWAVAECLHALAVGRRGTTWNVLCATTVCMLVALALQVLPPIAGVQVSGLPRVGWAFAAVASPLLIVMGMPLANALTTASVASPAPQGEAFDWSTALQDLQANLAAQIENLQLAPVQAMQINLQTPAASHLQAPLATHEAPPAQLQQPEALQADDASRLLARLRELQGQRLVDAIPQLTAEGFTKSQIADALSRPLYQLSPSRLKRDEVLTMDAPAYTADDTQAHVQQRRGLS